MDEDYRIIKVRPLISDMPRADHDEPVTIRRAANGYLIEFRGDSQRDRRLVADDLDCLLAVILHLFESRPRDEASLPPGFYKGSRAYEAGYTAGEADGCDEAKL